jgi:Fe2+ transport system protein B
MESIDETMNSFKESSERNNAMEELWKNIQELKESNPKNQAYLKKYEIEKLEDLYQKILENLDQDKNKWMERVYPLILNMSFDLRLFFDDLFEVVQKFLNLSEDNASYVESIFKTMIKEQRVSERLKINKGEL